MSGSWRSLPSNVQVSSNLSLHFPTTCEKLDSRHEELSHNGTLTLNQWCGIALLVTIYHMLDGLAPFSAGWIRCILCLHPQAGIWTRWYSVSSTLQENLSSASKGGANFEYMQIARSITKQHRQECASNPVSNTPSASMIQLRAGFVARLYDASHSM